MTFTSDLTIDEVLLIEDVGFEPIDFVMGSSYYNIGTQWGSWSENQELEKLTEAMSSARHFAMSDLLRMAEAVDADGVVGIRLDAHHQGDHANFTVLGTAVRRRDGRGAMWRDRGRPFTSDLSGHEFWSLVRGGFRPARLVMGNCVYHVAHQSLAAWFKQVNANVENELFTQALYDAREIAMERVENEGIAAGAAGVVGLDVHEGRFGWGAHVIEFFGIGTAVIPLEEEFREAPTKTEVILSARDT